LGNTPPPHLFSPAGSYYGIHFIDDIFGCRSDTADFLTIVDSFPVTVGGEKYILKGSSAYLNPYVSGATTILWTPIVPAGLTNDYLDYNDVENPICTPLDSVIYRIDAKTEGGCAAPPVYFTVKLFIEPNIPNAFSPNGDGVNDTWDITSLQYFSGSSVQVFTRSGQLVYNSLGYSKPWKGNDLSGSPLPVGVYYYIIKFGLGLQPKSGSITILR
jgi:gliding motility-associated-like protein